MANEEASRQALYARLTEVLGSEHAVTLMRHLPAPKAAELATKADVQALRSDLGKRMDRVEERMDRVDDRFHDLDTALREQTQYLGAELRAQARSSALTSIASTTTVVAAVFVAAAVF